MFKVRAIPDPTKSDPSIVYPPPGETRYGRGNCGPAAARSHAPNNLFKTVCQKGGSVWQTVYKTEASETEETESYWDVVFIGIPIPVQRTKSVKSVRLYHYKRVYRCNGTVSDWELVSTSDGGRYESGTITKAFGLFEWSPENQKQAADYGLSNLTAKVTISGGFKGKKPRQNDQLQGDVTSDPTHNSLNQQQDRREPTNGESASQQPNYVTADIHDVIIPYHPEFEHADPNSDPADLWVADKDLWGWVDAINNPTIFKPFYDRNSGKTYVIKPGSIMRKSELPPAVASHLSGIPDWIEIVDVRLAPRTESLHHDEFAGPLVNLQMTFTEYSKVDPTE